MKNYLVGLACKISNVIRGATYGIGNLQYELEVVREVEDSPVRDTKRLEKKIKKPPFFRKIIY